MTENRHNCPISIWETFDEEGKRRYNNVLDKTLKHQDRIIHPMAIQMQHIHWEAICRQFACIAGWNDWHRDYTSPKQPSVFTDIDKLNRLGNSKN